MRVEVIETIPKGRARGDARAPDAAASLAVKSLLMALESDDSLLKIAEPLANPSTEVAEGGGFYLGEFLLEFRETEQARQRSLHFLLVEKLIELLKEAGSAQSLTATLCLTSRSEGAAGQKQLVLWVKLAAKGDSPEQAALRWSLGVTHLQQALLFTSRHLRMQWAQRG